MKSAIIAALLALGHLLSAHSASAKAVAHVVKAGDTPESIAADYYGNRALAVYIIEGNGLSRAQALKPGQRLHIPTAFHYRIRKGDTLDGLAKKFLDDGRRAPFLAQMSGIKMSDKLHEGQDLLVPFQFVHHATAPESLQAVAQAFYGDASKAKLLADYNFRSSPMIGKGERVLVPIAHVRVRSIRLQAAPVVDKPGKPGKAVVEKIAPLEAAPVKEAQKREAELAERVGLQLKKVEKSYKDGDYSAVASSLDKLLTEEEPSEAQLAEIFRLKAFAYVALDLPDLATQSFREAIVRKPDLKLDAATVSPKIRAALDRARKLSQ